MFDAYIEFNSILSQKKIDENYLRYFLTELL